MTNQIVWFDIPVVDLDRAIKFYSQVLAIEVKKDSTNMPMGVFMHKENQPSGCLFQSNEEKPSGHGLLLYFNVNGRLDEAVKLVDKNGGKVLKPKHQIGPYGFRATIQDSEGNRIALHSEK